MTHFLLKKPIISILKWIFWLNILIYNFKNAENILNIIYFHSYGISNCVHTTLKKYLEDQLQMTMVNRSYMFWFCYSGGAREKNQQYLRIFTELCRERWPGRKKKALCAQRISWEFAAEIPGRQAAGVEEHHQG